MKYGSLLKLLNIMKSDFEGQAMLASLPYNALMSALMSEHMMKFLGTSLYQKLIIINEVLMTTDIAVIHGTCYNEKEHLYINEMICMLLIYMNLCPVAIDHIEIEL
ncbi:hypothetical protein ACJX0J_014038 [Zea mays]